MSKKKTNIKLFAEAGNASVIYLFLCYGSMTLCVNRPTVECSAIDRPAIAIFSMHHSLSLSLILIWFDNFLVPMQCMGNLGCFTQGKRAAIVWRYTHTHTVWSIVKCSKSLRTLKTKIERNNENRWNECSFEEWLNLPPTHFKHTHPLQPFPKCGSEKPLGFFSQVTPTNHTHTHTNTQRSAT